MHQLITLRFSHYNEKARWALDLSGMPYREEGHMPIFSQLAVFRATRGRGGRADRVSSRYSTPVLIRDDGTALVDSSEIVAFAAPELFADPRARELDRRFSDRLGPHTRRCMYFYALQDPSLLRTMADRNVSTIEANLFKMLSPLGAALVRSQLRVNEAGFKRSSAAIEEELTLAESLLTQHPFLASEKFSGADLSFACMLAPAVLPPEYGAELPKLSELAAAPRAFIEEIRARPAGQHALRMFAEHRRPILRGREARGNAVSPA